MSNKAWEALKAFLENTEGRLVAVGVSAVLEDGNVSTMFVSEDRAFPLLGATSYLHHRILTEVIQPPPFAPAEPSEETHQSSGAWTGAQKHQDGPNEEEG